MSARLPQRRIDAPAGLKALSQGTAVAVSLIEPWIGAAQNHGLGTRFALEVQKGLLARTSRGPAKAVTLFAYE